VVRTLVREGPAGKEELRSRSGIESDEDLYQVIQALEKDRIVAESEGIYRIREGEK
jgi:hypothetical protein